MLEYIKQVREVSPAALTVRAQTISPNDKGMLRWDHFLPRQDTDTIRLSDVLSTNYRPVADRREWNAPGRRVPLVTPNIREMEMVPIEAESVVDELEMQVLNERSGGNAQIFMDLIKARLPARAEMLAEADYRRLEVDAMQAWSQGTITQRNPQDASKTKTFSFGFDAGRYQTASPIWSNGGVNAYNEFLAWLEDGIDAIGSVVAAVMRLATFKVIQADAPLIPLATVGNVPTRADLEKRIQDELAGEFKFIIIEDSFDVFTDGGTTYSRTKVWPANVVAAVPAGERIGTTFFAPVIRAQQISQQVPEAAIDVNGVTVFHIEQNDGRELKIQAQLNALPVPNEQLAWVMNAGA